MVLHFRRINRHLILCQYQFCSKYKSVLNDIPSGFHSNGIFNISEINGIHSQLETCLRYQ